MSPRTAEGRPCSFSCVEGKKVVFVKCLGFGLNLKATGLEARLKMGLREMKGKDVKKVGEKSEIL